MNKIDPTYPSIHDNCSFVHFYELLGIVVYLIIVPIKLINDYISARKVEGFSIVVIFKIFVNWLIG